MLIVEKRGGLVLGKLSPTLKKLAWLTLRNFDNFAQSVAVGWSLIDLIFVAWRVSSALNWLVDRGGPLTWSRFAIDQARTSLRRLRRCGLTLLTRLLSRHCGLLVPRGHLIY